MSEELIKNGNNALQKGDFAKAMEFYNKAIKLTPNDFVLYCNRSAIFLSQSKFQEALTDAEMCIKLDPKRGIGYVRKADALNQMGKGQEAAKIIEEAAKIDPNDQTVKERQEQIRDFSMEQWRLQIFAQSDQDLLMKMQANAKVMQLMKKDSNLFERACQARKTKNFMELMSKDANLAEMMIEFMGMSKAVEDQKQKEQKEHPEQKQEEVPKQNDDEAQKKDKELKDQAEKKKNEGNDFFKNGQYESALKCYEGAFEIFKNITYLNNAATALLKMEKYEESLKKAELAYQFGKENMWASTIPELAKSLAKQGSALHKMCKYPEAIAKLKDSLEQNRDKQVLATLQKIEEEFEQIKLNQQYKYDDAFKIFEEAQQAAKQPNYDKVIQLITDGLKFLPDQIKEDKAINLQIQMRALRSFSLFKNQLFSACSEDTKYVLDKDPKNVKALLTKAEIEKMRKQWYLAFETYQLIFQLDPGNVEAIDANKVVAEKIDKIKQSELTDEEFKEINKIAMQDNEMKMLSHDPSIVQAIQEMQEHPSVMTKLLADPVVGKKLQKLIHGGIIRLRK